MLKNRYQEILIGMGPMSLIRGIISLRRNRSTLLIDDKRFSVESYHGLFLSELEVLALLRLGKKYDIPELTNLRQFLSAGNIELVTEKRRLKLGQSPLANIKELLRKFPELLDASDLDEVYAENEEDFSRFFLEEISRYENKCAEESLRSKGYRFDFQGPKWLKTIYTRFGQFLNTEYQSSHSLKFPGLLHLLGLSAEEKLKTGLSAEDLPFYFFRSLSPIYRLQDFFLTTQLKRRLVILGGDYKESTVQFWQFHENKFENLLLSSFEGVISGDRVLFFSHLPTEVPFKIASPYSFFRKTQMLPVKRSNSPFPAASLTYITHSDLLGSESPYRVHGEGSEFSFYHWPYPEAPGSKPLFYERDLKKNFSEDAELLPFKAEEVSSAPSGSVTLDLRPLKVDRKHEAPVLKRLPIEIVVNNRPVQGFEYWGPFRYNSLGLLSLAYGIEGI